MTFGREISHSNRADSFSLTSRSVRGFRKSRRIAVREQNIFSRGKSMLAKLKIANIDMTASHRHQHSAFTDYLQKTVSYSRSTLRKHDVLKSLASQAYVFASSNVQPRMMSFLTLPSEMISYFFDL